MKRSNIMNAYLLCMAFCIVMIVQPFRFWPNDAAAEEIIGAIHENRGSAEDLEVESPVSFIFNLYQGLISPIDGGRCPMYPSCSQYARRAVNERGGLEGALMTFDRLLRCGRDLGEYPMIFISGRTLYYDPVSRKTD